MSCRLTEMNVLDQAYYVAKHYPGGVESLARRMGVAPATLYNKLRRQVSTHHLSVEELSEIIDCCEEAKVADVFAPLEALAWRHRHIVVPLPDTGDASHAELVELICNMVREQGEVAQKIHEALQNDNVIDEREFDAIDKEVQDAIQALMALKAKVGEMHETAKAKGLIGERRGK